MWNTRDERLGWVKDLGRIIGHENDPFSAEELPRRSRSPTWPAAPRRVDELPYAASTYRPRRLAQLLHHLPRQRYAPALLIRCAELLATHPALANSSGLALPYITVCIRATLS